MTVSRGWVIASQVHPSKTETSGCTSI